MNKINNLKSNQEIKYRKGFHGRERVDWQDWQTGPIHVEKDRQGLICVLALKNDSWAEYDPRRHHFQENIENDILFMDAEEYCLEIDLNSI